MSNLNPILNAIKPDFVSKNYQLINTSDLISTIQAQGWHATAARYAKVRNPAKDGFQKHELIFRHDNFKGDADSIPQLILRNSHDRTAALEFHLGFFRFACSNGLIVGNGLISSMKVYHVGNNLADKIGAMVTQALDNVPKVVEARNSMVERVMSLDESADFGYRAAAIISNIRKIDSDVARIIRPKRSADYGNTLWQLFNVVQERSLSALTGSRIEERADGSIARKTVHGRKISSLDIDTKLNKQLFDLALTYVGGAK